MRSSGVGNVSAIMPFLRAAMTRRVDVVGIFDSNGGQLGITGHAEGQAMALATIFGAYGTAFVPGKAVTPYSSGIAGHTANPTDGGSVNAGFTAIKFPAVSAVDSSTVPWSNFDWQNTMVDTASGYMAIESRFPLDINGAIGYCPVFWRPQTGGVTKWRPGVADMVNTGGAASGQLYNAPSDLAMSAVPADGISEERWTIPRGTLMDLTNTNNPAYVASGNTLNYKGVGLVFRVHRYNGEGAMDGSNTCGLIGHRITDEEKFHGVAYSTLYTYGGKPTRAASLDICGVDLTQSPYTSKGPWALSTTYALYDTVTDGGVTYVCVQANTSAANTEPGVGAFWQQYWTTGGGLTDAALGAYLKGLAKAQRDSNGVQLAPMLLVQIIEGGNDSNDTSTIGPCRASKSILSTTGAYQSAVEQASASNTATGYYNNTVTIMRRIRYVWETVLGYNGGNLFFLIGCYHPQSPSISAAQFSFCRTTMVTGMASVAASERNVCYVDGYKLGNYAEFGVVNGAKAASTGADGTDFVSAGAPRTQAVVNGAKTPNAGSGVWTDATAYIVGDIVSDTNVFYTCIVAHTSSAASDRPNSGSTWATKWNVTAGHMPWYRGPYNEDAHLNQQGYLHWGARVWGAIMDAARNTQAFITPKPKPGRVRAR